ncbi:MAG: DUF5930 domain-containing protein [Pseudomonadota bacterium]
MVDSLNRALSGVLPDRRIYVRTEQRTRYTEFSPISQLGLALVAAGVIAWSSFATTAYITRATDAHRAELRMETMREAYEARLAAATSEQVTLETALQTATERGDAITERLAAKQLQLVENANALQEARLELDHLRSSYIAMVDEREAAAEDLAGIERELRNLQLNLATAHTQQSGMTDALSVFTGTMDQVIIDRDLAASRSHELGRQVEDLQAEITKWENRQERVLSQLETAARTSLSALNKVFERTNIDLDRILEETRRDYSGEGGLFEPITGSEAEEAGEADQRVAALMSDLERVNLMRLAADRLPYGRPVIGARRTSGFGIRRDPFRRKSSMHSGVDFAAPRGTPIYATANGVVVFAGRQSGYGIIVKIKHAFGFETFYAHLSRARVEVGAACRARRSYRGYG